MRFLNTIRVLSNMRLAVAHLRGLPVRDQDLKPAFIEAINAAQSTSIRSLAHDLYLEFENPELVTRLVERTVFSRDEVLNGAHLFTRDERTPVGETIRGAKQLLAKTIPDLYHLVTELVGSVAAYKIPGRDGGSVSCCIGVIWLSPRPDWSVEYCAEMLVHEFIHNSVFLEDMARGIMPTPALLEHEQALTISAIRRTRRPYDKAFHSACVAAGIMYYYHCIGNLAEADRHLIPLQQTVKDLCERDQALRRQGLDVLTENGREVLGELEQFVASGPKYMAITDDLAVQ